uniref:Uncharacterized protein n=1 Tax=Candidatus Kentrum sp. DK TaxID=2126562 RepID=A0A450TEM5_9GAMM|nr:MAG: hypothetical protein BECKDK2373B_GA0170837_11502 [Candidatus Kentron sp. DK]
MCFDHLIAALSEGRVLFDVEHPNEARYPRQRILCVDINGYAYICPYVVERDGTRFPKTLFPSRKHTKRFIAEKP